MQSFYVKWHKKIDMLTDNKVLVDAKFLREMAQKNSKEF
jgi:hypothetical protein